MSQKLSGSLRQVPSIVIDEVKGRVTVSSKPEAAIIYTGPSPRGWHRLQQAAECLQKYAWQYEAPKTGEVKPTSPALAKGSLIHLALAQHYARIQAVQRGEDPESWCEPAEAVRLIAQLEGTEAYADVSVAAYESYIAHYPDDAAEMKILGIEELVSTKIAGKYLLTGRLDLAYEDLGGRIWVMDHKTTGYLKSAHKQFYTISGQLLGYSHMAREKYGEKYAGLKVNLIQHGKPKFERITLPRSPNLESRFEGIVVDIEESVERIQASGRDFDDWPKAINELTCYHRYGACKFIDQCRWGAGAKKAGNWTWDDQ
jgi:hypothetical protein